MAARHIGFIGGGNMAGSLVAGLLDSGFAPSRVLVADLDQGKLARLVPEHGVAAADGEQQIGADCDLIVLAVKPQSMEAACAALRPALAGRAPLIVSVAAGVTLARIARWLGPSLPIVRCMPNTPALIGAGAAGLYANANTSAEHRREVEELMNTVGLCAWCGRESDLDIVTALSGSGPAYFFLFMEAMRDAATKMGLDAALAETLTRQTALGAARLAQAQAEEAGGPDLAELRARVTSPGGTTEAAINRFERDGFRELVDAALAAAAGRARELATSNG